MITVFIRNIKTAENVLQSALLLSRAFKKECAVVSCAPSGSREHSMQNEIEQYIEKESAAKIKTYVLHNGLSGLSALCEELEASFLFMQLEENKSAAIRKYLQACRSLRIPYIIFKDTFAPLHTDRILVPVTFLEEEYEKAQFASAFGRFCKSEIHLLPANDYGTKAAATTRKMEELFSRFHLRYRTERAASDSFKVEKEAAAKSASGNYGLVLLSASRDYGLDDLLFGPKEQHLIKKSEVPLLLVNPRGDLYALCD